MEVSETKEPTCAVYFYSIERYEKAREAYQRSVPAPPRVISSDHGDILWECVACKKIHNDKKIPNYCSECGKAILSLGVETEW